MVMTKLTEEINAQLDSVIGFDHYVTGYDVAKVIDRLDSSYKAVKRYLVDLCTYEVRIIPHLNGEKHNTTRLKFLPTMQDSGLKDTVALARDGLKNVILDLIKQYGDGVDLHITIFSDSRTRTVVEFSFILYYSNNAVHVKDNCRKGNVSNEAFHISRLVPALNPEIWEGLRKRIEKFNRTFGPSIFSTDDSVYKHTYFTAELYGTKPVMNRNTNETTLKLHHLDERFTLSEIIDSGRPFELTAYVAAVLEVYRKFIALNNLSPMLVVLTLSNGYDTANSVVDRFIIPTCGGEVLPGVGFRYNYDKLSLIAD